MQKFKLIDEHKTIYASLLTLNQNFESLVTCNAGNQKPVGTAEAPLYEGMFWLNSASKKIYQLVDKDADNWKLVIDLNGNATTQEYVDERIANHNHDKTYLKKDAPAADVLKVNGHSANTVLFDENISDVQGTSDPNIAPSSRLFEKTRQQLNTFVATLGDPDAVFTQLRNLIDLINHNSGSLDKLTVDNISGLRYNLDSRMLASTTLEDLGGIRGDGKSPSGFTGRILFKKTHAIANGGALVVGRDDSRTELHGISMWDDNGTTADGVQVGDVTAPLYLNALTANSLKLSVGGNQHYKIWNEGNMPDLLSALSGQGYMLKADADARYLTNDETAANALLLNGAADSEKPVKNSIAKRTFEGDVIARYLRTEGNEGTKDDIGYFLVQKEVGADSNNRARPVSFATIKSLLGGDGGTVTPTPDDKDSSFTNLPIHDVESSRPRQQVNSSGHQYKRNRDHCKYFERVDLTIIEINTQSGAIAHLTADFVEIETFDPISPGMVYLTTKERNSFLQLRGDTLVEMSLDTFKDVPDGYTVKVAYTPVAVDFKTKIYFAFHDGDNSYHYAYRLGQDDKDLWHSVKKPVFIETGEGYVHKAWHSILDYYAVEILEPHQTMPSVKYRYYDKNGLGSYLPWSKRVVWHAKTKGELTVLQTSPVTSIAPQPYQVVQEDSGSLLEFNATDKATFTLPKSMKTGSFVYMTNKSGAFDVHVENEATIIGDTTAKLGQQIKAVKVPNNVWLCVTMGGSSGLGAATTDQVDEATANDVALTPATLNALTRIKIGYKAGGSYVGTATLGKDSVYIGGYAGVAPKGGAGIGIGLNAANSGQQNNAVAIGQKAGKLNQQSYAVAIGYEAGSSTQGARAIAIGRDAGVSKQPAGSIAIGVSTKPAEVGGISIASATDTADHVAELSYLPSTKVWNLTNKAGDAVFHVNGKEMKGGSDSGSSDSGFEVVKPLPDDNGKPRIIDTAQGTNINVLDRTNKAFVERSDLKILEIDEVDGSVKLITLDNGNFNEIETLSSIAVPGRIYNTARERNSFLVYHAGDKQLVEYDIDTLAPKDGGFTMVVKHEPTAVDLETQTYLYYSAPDRYFFASSFGDQDDYLWRQRVDDHSMVASTGLGYYHWFQNAHTYYTCVNAETGNDIGDRVSGTNIKVDDVNGSYLAYSLRVVVCSKTANNVKVYKTKPVDGASPKPYTIKADDEGKLLQISDAKQATFLIPDGFPVGFHFEVTNGLGDFRVQTDGHDKFWNGQTKGHAGQSLRLVKVTSTQWLTHLSGSAVGFATTADMDAQTSNTVAVTPKSLVLSKHVRMGADAGKTKQGTYSVALGYSAGKDTQSGNSVAIGANAGNTRQQRMAVAIGDTCAKTVQGQYAVAIGGSTAQFNQGQSSVAMGYQAANDHQGNYAVAIGSNAGRVNQGETAVAVGYRAGNGTQGKNSVAVGNSAGETNLGAGAIAIGTNAVMKEEGGIVIASVTAGESNVATLSYTPSTKTWDLTNKAGDALLTLNGQAVTFAPPADDQVAQLTAELSTLKQEIAALKAAI